jgi:hypothetical protein
VVGARAREQQLMIVQLQDRIFLSDLCCWCNMNNPASNHPPLTVQQRFIVDNIVQQCISQFHEQQAAQGLPRTQFTPQQLDEATNLAIQQMLQQSQSQAQAQQQQHAQFFLPRVIPTSVAFHQNQFIPLRSIATPAMPLTPAQLAEQAAIQAQAAMQTAHQAMNIATQAQQMARQIQQLHQPTPQAQNRSESATPATSALEDEPPPLIEVNPANVISINTAPAGVQVMSNTADITPTETAKFLAQSAIDNISNTKTSEKKQQTAAKHRETKPAPSAISINAADKSKSAASKSTAEAQSKAKAAAEAKISSNNSTAAPTSGPNYSPSSANSNLPPFPFTTEQQRLFHPGIRLIHSSPGTSAAPPLQYLLTLRPNPTPTEPNPPPYEVPAFPALAANDSQIVLLFQHHPSAAFHQVVPPPTLELPTIEELKRNRALHQHQQQENARKQAMEKNKAKEEQEEQRALQELGQRKQYKQQNSSNGAENISNCNKPPEHAAKRDETKQGRVLLACPELERVVLSSSSIELQWLPVPHSSRYSVEIKLSANKYEKLYESSAASFVVSNLQPRSSYSFRIRAIAGETNSFQDSDYSDIMQFNTLNTKVKG